MKVKKGVGISAIKGKLGGFVIQDPTAGTIVKVKTAATYPKTLAQSLSKALFVLVNASWRNLTILQQSAWTAASIDFPRTDIFGTTYYLTGFELFSEINNNRIRSGLNPLVVPPAPVVIPGYTKLEWSVDSNIHIWLTTTPGTVPAGNIMEVWATPEFSRGRNYYEGKFRLLGHYDTASVGPFDITSMYSAIFGAILNRWAVILCKVRNLSTATGTVYSPFLQTNVYLPFTAVQYNLIAIGNKNAVSTLKLRSTNNCTLTLTAGVLFYDDPAGTLNPGSVRTVTPGALRTFYIKGPVDATLTFSSPTLIIGWGDNTNYGWGGSGNGHNLAGSLSDFINCTIYRVATYTTITGDISKLPGLTNCYITGLNTVFGDISNLHHLTTLDIDGYNTVFGSINNLTLLTHLDILGSNTVTGDVSLCPLINTFNIDGFNTLYGSLSPRAYCTTVIIKGLNTVSGNIAAITSLTEMTIWGSNTLSGSITGLNNLRVIDVKGFNTLSGSINGKTSLRRLHLEGNNTVVGTMVLNYNMAYAYLAGGSNITGIATLWPNLTECYIFGTNPLTGVLSGFTAIVRLQLEGTTAMTGVFSSLTYIRTAIIKGLNNVTGTLNSMVRGEQVEIDTPGVVNYSSCAAVTGLSSLILPPTVVFTSANVNTLLANFWANRNANKGLTVRLIDLRGAPGTGAPTGQGLIDKANLQAYRSPNNLPQYALWTVLTR